MLKKRSLAIQTSLRVLHIFHRIEKRIYIKKKIYCLKKTTFGEGQCICLRRRIQVCTPKSQLGRNAKRGKLRQIVRYCREECMRPATSKTQTVPRRISSTDTHSAAANFFGRNVGAPGEGDSIDSAFILRWTAAGAYGPPQPIRGCERIR